MANIESTQTGNWATGSTWVGGSVPSAGDTVNIASGHTVTYSADTTTQFGDIDIDGILVHSKSMNVTGKVTIDGGGTLHQKPGSKILFAGDRNALHGLWFENEANVTHIAEGSDGLPTTKLSGAHGVNSLYFEVDDASTFATGEWFAVFNNHGTTIRNLDYHPIKKQDEGFWITEVDTSTNPDRIYFRHFVGPKDVKIASSNGVSGSTITVTNGKVYRRNQYITFGTGNIRNHCRVASINGNILTLKNNADENAYSIVGNSSTLANIYVYKTGTVKPHGDDDRVRKCATITTSAKAANSTTIDLAQDEKFEQGDVILIEYPLEAGQTAAEQRSIYNGTSPASYDAGFSGDSVMHVVQSRSSNTLTLTAQIGYVVPAGALVTRMTRDIVIGAQNSGANDVVESTNVAYYYVEHTNNWSRHLVLKDVWFKNIGSYKSSVYSGVVVRGRASTVGAGNGTDANGNAWSANTYPNPVYSSMTIDYQRSDREPYFEGLSIQCNPPETHNWGGFWSYDFRGATVRCSTSTQGLNGFAWYHEPNGSGFNNFAYCVQGDPFNWRGVGEDVELAYCYGGRGRYGLFIEALYNNNVHDIMLNVTTDYPMRCYRGEGQKGVIYNIDSKDAYYKFPQMDSHSGIWTIHNAKFHGIDYYNNNNSPLSGQTRVSGSSYAGRQGYFIENSICRVIEQDFEYDNVVNVSYYMVWRWDATENAYAVYRSSHDDGEQAALIESIYVPANVTCKIKLTCKPTSGFSGTEPRLWVGTPVNKFYSDTDNTHSRTYGADYWSSRAEGGHYIQQFASFESNTDWQTLEYTVPTLPYPQQIQAGVVQNDSDSWEGFFMKPIDIQLSGSGSGDATEEVYHNPDMNLSNRNVTITKQYKTKGTKKRRFGGVS